jgi:hypothetical protein
MRSIGSVLGAPPPSPPKTRRDRAAEHWQFLFEHGRVGEAQAYLEVLDANSQLPPDEIFNAVEARMASS